MERPARSLRRRLTLVLGLGFVLLSAGGALLVERLVRRHALAELDGTLLAKARAFQALTESEQGKIELDYTPAAMPEYEREDQPEYFQIRLDDGALRLSSRRLPPGTHLPHSTPVPDSFALHDLVLPDGRPGRALELAYLPHRVAPEDAAPGASVDAPDAEALGPLPAEHRVVVTVARSRAGVDALLASTRTALLTGGGLAACLAVLLVWRALARGFRPVDAIAAQVARLDADGLHARVHEPGTPREIAPVVEQINRLLARLEDVLGRERRFTGNVAHELRTPIAELRTLAAVGARWPGDEASVEQFFRDVEVIAGRMEGVVSDLLLLARCQAGAELVLAGEVPLGEALATAWAPRAAAAARAGIAFTAEVPHDLVVRTDAGKLGLILSNLLGNAVSHARPGATVRVQASRSGPLFRLEVLNEAAPLDPADLERLTEPFWRKDPARSPGEHAGLGLALVRALGELLGLRVAFSQDARGLFCARVEGEALTAAAPASEAAPLSRS